MLYLQYICYLAIVVQSPSCVWPSVTLWSAACRGLPVTHHQPEFSQVHVHWIGDVIQPSHLPTISSSNHLKSYKTNIFIIPMNVWYKFTTSHGVIFWGSKITADGDCSHEIKRCLLLERKTMTNLDTMLKTIDSTLPTKVCLVKPMVFQ